MPATNCIPTELKMKMKERAIGQGCAPLDTTLSLKRNSGGRGIRIYDRTVCHYYGYNNDCSYRVRYLGQMFPIW